MISAHAAGYSNLRFLVHEQEALPAELQVVVINQLTPDWLQIGYTHWQRLINDFQYKYLTTHYRIVG